MSTQENPTPLKPLNAFTLLRDILAAIVGIRSRKERARDFAQASTLSWLGAILIFVIVAYAAIRLFVHLIQA